MSGKADSGQLEYIVSAHLTSSRSLLDKYTLAEK